MLQRSLRQLQHVVTALVLLIVILIGAEMWIRIVRPVPALTVATQADIARQSCLVPSATQHHQMRPLSDVLSDDGAVQFRTNSLGLRGPEPQEAAADNTLRILLLGDDTVAGPWLPDEHTLSAQLERHLSGQLEGQVEVINAGVPGYSPLLSLLQYEQDLARLQPDVVVLHVDMSDVGDESVHRARLRTEGSRPVCIHPALAQAPRPPHPLISFMRSSALANLLKDRVAGSDDRPAQSARYTWTSPSPDSVQSHVRHTVDSVMQLQKSTHSRGQLLMVATAPVCWQVLPPDRFPDLCRRYGLSGSQPVGEDVPFEVLAAWSQEAGVPLCSAVDAFREFESPEKLFRADCPRLSDYGTALYALTLARQILATPPAVAGHVRVRH